MKPSSQWITTINRESQNEKAVIENKKISSTQGPKIAPKTKPIAKKELTK